MKKISSLLFCGIFLAAALQAASPSSQWHVTKETTLGTLPGNASLRSVTLEQCDQKGLCQQATVKALLFSAAFFHLQLLDVPARNQKLSQVMESAGCVAGINASYFHPNGTPLGLVMTHGKVIHPQERAKLLSGLLLETRDNIFLLRPTEKFPKNIKEAVQAGPFLVDHAAVVNGLETTHTAWRTFIATDEHGNCLMGTISPVTLAEASQVLLAVAPSFFKTTKMKRALNLDGGSSTALWVRLEPTPFSQEERGYVRNFLGLRQKN
ncbi:MAG: phosphodiester glycosidase family protein [Chthoniobacterales bacterium]|nr:phosphodiester glycosidase family protein [Chthoniobacterales bacterium]